MSIEEKQDVIKQMKGETGIQYAATMLKDIKSLANNYIELIVVENLNKFLESVSYDISTKLMLFVENDGFTRIIECIDDKVEHQALKIQKSMKLLNPKKVKIGRYYKDEETFNQRDIYFKENDKTVARKQAQITLVNQIPRISCKGKNSVRFLVDQRQRYQIYQNCVLQAGIGSGSLRIHVSRLSRNSFIDSRQEADINFHLSKTSKHGNPFYIINKFFKSERLDPQLNGGLDGNDDNADEMSQATKVDENFLIPQQEQNEQVDLPDGFIELKVLEESQQVTKFKSFLLKPGQVLKIGKNNDCDLILDPPREEEDVIGDVQFFVGYETIEPHAEPPLDLSKKYEPGYKES